MQLQYGYVSVHYQHLWHNGHFLRLVSSFHQLGVMGEEKWGRLKKNTERMRKTSIFQIIVPKQYNDAFILVLEFHSNRSTTLVWAWGSFNCSGLLWCCPPQQYVSAVFLPVPALALMVAYGASMEEACGPGWKPVTDFWWDEEQVRCFHSLFVWDLQACRSGKWSTVRDCWGSLVRGWVSAYDLWLLLVAKTCLSESW